MTKTISQTSAAVERSVVFRGGSPNEIEAATALQDAVSDFGPASPEAEAARRHLRLVQHFNERFAWFRD